MNKPIIGLNMDFTEAADGKLRMTSRAEYAAAVTEAGGIPYLVPCVADSDLLDFHVSKVDGFIFVGGEDYNSKHFGEPLHEKAELIHERREAVDLLLAEKVLAMDLPVLGICAGVQLISIACEGKIVQHLATASDGAVEAIESTDDRFVLGVQWHPELMDETHRRGIFTALVEVAKEEVAN